MKDKKSIYLMAALGLFFLFLDQFLKWQALHSWNFTRLINRFLGWEPFLNPGVAFGIPLPNIITIIFSLIIIGMITYILFDKTETNIKNQISKIKNFSLILILCGALSNLIDRIIYQHTVDYFLILTGIINLADVLIVLGFGIFFIDNFKKE